MQNQEEETKDTIIKKILHEVLEWVITTIGAFAIAIFISFFIIVNAKVPTSSMEKTIMTGDRVLGLRLAYVFSEPERGDVVIFKYPDNEKILYIKRIIGMPGDKVEIKEGKVFINDEALSEPYLRVTTNGNFGPYQVPEGHYFMMGDNRNNSADSRYWENTYLEREKIVGKALFCYYPNFNMLNY